MASELTRLAELGWHPPPLSEAGVYCPPDQTAAAGISYPEVGVDVLGSDGGVGYWFDHRATEVSKVLHRFGIKTLWEIGSGNGGMALRLKRGLEEVVAVEPRVAGALVSARLGLTSFCASIHALELPDNSIECIGAFDVIEHLPCESDFLREVHRVLRPGGFAVITVPAHQFLWAAEDEVSGHHRRYSKRQLDGLLTEHGFSSLDEAYIFSCLVPPALVTRVIPYQLNSAQDPHTVMARLNSQLRVPRTVDNFVRAVLSIEMRVSRHFTLPFGLSLLGVFRALKNA